VTSESVRRRATGAGRLSTQDWTTRALELLVDEGVGAVKVARMCRELGVTKGSFYWHFDDLVRFLASELGARHHEPMVAPAVTSSRAAEPGGACRPPPR
jgi:AcrR family transcriptional regulator